MEGHSKRPKQFTRSTSTMASSPMMPVCPTSSIVDRPWKSVSLPPGMATPYWCSLTMSLRMATLLSLRTDSAPDLAHHSPLRMSLGLFVVWFFEEHPPRSQDPSHFVG
eukprot:1343801-Heterocapsa_arctica.AAC.1